MGLVALRTTISDGRPSSTPHSTNPLQPAQRTSECKHMLIGPIRFIVEIKDRLDACLAIDKSFDDKLCDELEEWLRRFKANRQPSAVSRVLSD